MSPPMAASQCARWMASRRCDLQGAQLVDALDLAVGQGLMNDPVDGASVGVAELIGGSW